jgi:phospho-N-acetylmuramoyl-pentapeptide-transferase
MMISVWFVLPSLRVSALWASCLCGSVVGFLFWNVYPAKLFMGDTGSLFLGGAIGGLAISSGRPVMFLIVSFVFIADFASSILQISIFKITKHLSKKKEGWRLFKTAPVHHTFQRSGWSETKISLLFSTVTILLCLFGIVIYL